MKDTEKEKMLRGELYDASDATLTSERLAARRLLHRLNVTEYGDPKAYSDIIASLLPNASSDVVIEAPFFCDYGYNIHIGENVYFNFNCVVLDVLPVTIGANVLFGPNAQIYTATHPMDAVERRGGLEAGSPVTIGDDCWIGGNVVICPGVAIGARSVIAAGAVVTRNIPADAVAAGSPAKPTKSSRANIDRR